MVSAALRRPVVVVPRGVPAGRPRLVLWTSWGLDWQARATGRTWPATWPAHLASQRHRLLRLRRHLLAGQLAGDAVGPPAVSRALGRRRPLPSGPLGEHGVADGRRRLLTA